MSGNREQKPVRRGFRSALDFIGIGLSLLCLVHCLALPLLIVLAPVIVPACCSTIASVDPMQFAPAV